MSFLAIAKRSSKHGSNLDRIFLATCSLILFIFVVWPYLVLLFSIDDLRGLTSRSFWFVVLLTCFQAGLSTIFTLIFALCGGLGLLCLRQSLLRTCLQILILLPGVLPSVFVIVSVLNLFQLFGSFPMGIVGVVIMHVSMLVGIISIFFERIFKSKFGASVELARIEGAPRFQILVAILKGLTSDFINLGFFIFTICFGSFSIPLIVGSGTGDTVEVLIYRTLYGSHDVSLAAQWSFVQSTLLFALILMSKWTNQENKNPHEFINSDEGRYLTLSHLGSPTAMILLLLFSLAVLGSSVINLPEGILELQSSQVEVISFAKIMYSFLQALMSAAFVLLAFLGLFFLYSNHQLHGWMRGYNSPGIVIAGLAIYVLHDLRASDSWIGLLISAFCFSSLSFCGLYRLRGSAWYAQLQDQVQVARVLGAHQKNIFLEIVLPQVGPDLCFLAGLTGFWMSGEFALTTALLGKDVSLATSTQALLGGYRLSVATVTMWASLFVGSLVFAMMGGLGYVYRKKSRA